MMMAEPHILPHSGPSPGPVCREWQRAIHYLPASDDPLLDEGFDEVVEALLDLEVGDAGVQVKGGRRVAPSR